MNKWISSIAVAAMGGALLALPSTASAGTIQVPQNVIAGDYASGIIPVHSTRHTHNYGYNSGAAIAGAIIGGLAYGYGRRSYSQRSYGYNTYGYRRGYGYSYGYSRRPSYGYGYGHSYGGYGGYGGMYGGYR